MPKKLRIGINGYGRIGRCIHRIALESDDVEVVVIASRGDVECRAHLLKYDSLYGKLPHKITVGGTDHFLIDGQRVDSLIGKPGIDFQWSDFDVDVVIESTGVFRTREGMECHLAGGAKKVILSCPPKDDTPVFVMGVNAEDYAGQDIISNASCTTNCLAPVAKILHEQFGIESAHCTTVHSVTGDQNILDNTHRNLRRSRSFIPSIIPCRTGVSAAMQKVMPEVAKHFTGQALRVPTPVVSIVDLAANLSKDVTAEEVNEVLAREGAKHGLVGVSDEPLVSIDYRQDSRSAIIDGLSTQVVAGKFLKLLAWYDNEWGYSCRVVDMARHIIK